MAMAEDIDPSCRCIVSLDLSLRVMPNLSGLIFLLFFWFPAQYDCLCFDLQWIPFHQFINFTLTILVEFNEYETHAKRT